MKKKILIPTILIIFLAGHVPGRSQPTTKPYPVIGDQMPQFLLTNVHHYTKKTFAPEDVKGKWLIMDFWNRYCKPCMEDFPKVNDLQAEFKDQVQFLLVAKNNNNLEGTEQVYERMRKMYGLQLSVAYDSTLFEQFGINVAPYVIVVDPHGKVYAVTGASFLHRENIQNLVGNKKPAFERYYNKFEKGPPSEKWNYLVDENDQEWDFLYRSVLSKCNERRRVGLWNIDQHIKEGYYQITMANLYQLYNIAFFGEGEWHRWKPMYTDHWVYPILEIGDSSDFQFDYKNNKGLYNYSVIVPREKASKEYLMEVMQRDLKNYFGYNVSIEVRNVPYWRLTATEEAKNTLRTKSESFEILRDPTGIIGKKILIGLVLSHIEEYNADERIPFIDETNIKDRIDINISTAMANLDDVIKELKEHGLILVKSEREMKVLVIRDPEGINN